MTRLLERIGPASLLVALVAVLAGMRLEHAWVMGALGIFAVALSRAGVRRAATIATVYNRSTSVAGMTLGLVAVGLAIVKMAVVPLVFP
ncbi:hypothetical protein ACIBHX_35850 [Nonomuraea sp. NPDC050536]|uniref:hypothetical protein n=1 Tax=Nonomuraea sp. NPDC050536 TaxID=3364366 RepID=UPI0037C916FD